MLTSNFEIEHNFVDELVHSGHLQVEVHCQEDLAFHLEQLGDCIYSIAELNIFFRLYCIDFVVLAADEQASDS